MKQTLILALICVALAIVAVAYGDSQYATALGRPAPPIYARNATDTVSAASLKGGYTLLNFWSSTNAPSRKAANEYTAWLRNHPESRVRLVSINFDTNEALFHEIARVDSLEPSQQYHVRGDTARAIRTGYDLKKGYGSLLVDPDGRIVAHNPKPGDLP